MFTHIHHVLKMNNPRLKGHRRAKVVHYGSGIIAFLILAPNGSVRRLNDRLQVRLNHASERVGAGMVAAAVGGMRGCLWGLRGVNWLFLRRVALTSTWHKSFVSFAVLLTGGASFIKGLCHCTLIVKKCEPLSEERE